MKTRLTPRAPRAYQPSFADRARRYCLAGMKDKEVAKQLNVPLATLREWCETVPEFEDALGEGRGLGDGNIADGQYRLGIGCNHPAVRIFMPAGASDPIYAYYTRHYPPDGPTGRFWLAKRRPQDWGDNVETKAVYEDDSSKFPDGRLEAIADSGDSEEGPPDTEDDPC